MIHVHVNSSLVLSFDQSLLKKPAQTVLEVSQQGMESDLTILLTDDGQIREMNNKYRDLDEATDVLSFSSMESDPDTSRLYLGDVIISYDRAVDQARLADHDLLVEMQLLVVHGVLHLLGFDHANLEQRSKMWDSQEKILAKLGLSGIKIITEQM
ncbi:rRNA maturation RNase YbeY [Chloroflexota bacterium]